MIKFYIDKFFNYKSAVKLVNCVCVCVIEVLNVQLVICQFANVISWYIVVKEETLYLDV